MIDPYNIEIIDRDEKPEVIQLDIDMNNIPDCDIEEFDLSDEKDILKYFTTIEKSVRGSFEYKQYIKFLRENINMNKCSFFENVNNIDTFKVQIHIHHHPFDLFSITKIVFQRRVDMGLSLEVEEVAKEVMWLHYNLAIGLIPVCETVHELIHNYYLFVPIDKVLGQVDLFKEAYAKYIPQEQIDMLNTIAEYTKVYNIEANLNPLRRKYLYMTSTNEGAYNFPRYEDVIATMKRQIESIKNNNGKPLQQVVSLVQR